MTSVLEALTREHGIFNRLIDRVESSFRWGEDKAREEVREGMLVLLPALEKHDKIEDRVFSHPAYASRQDAKWLLDAVELEHRQIASLRNEIRSALQSEEKVSLPDLKSLLFLLTHKLRQHFQTEETILWPHYNHFARRSLERSPGAGLLKEVQALEEEVRQNSKLVAEYLGRRK